MIKDYLRWSEFIDETSESELRRYLGIDIQKAMEREGVKRSSTLIRRILGRYNKESLPFLLCPVKLKRIYSCPEITDIHYGQSCARCVKNYIEDSIIKIDW